MLFRSAFAVLRESGALVLGSQDAQPNLRIVVSHELLPPECELDPRRPTPVVLMTVKADPDRALRLTGFTLNPWAAPAPKRRQR